MSTSGKKWVVDIANGKERVVDIANGKEWVVDIDKKVQSCDLNVEAEDFRKPSIFRVPPFVRDWKEKAFTPQVVSFGPYHHDDPNLKPVEEHKLRALVHFLKRAGRPLEDFLKEMEGVVGLLWVSYHGLDQDEKWRNQRDKFLHLMVLDGCFMLEVLRNSQECYRKIYAPNDPVFSSHGEHHRMPYIKRDMLVYENQLPLLVLKTLLIAERSGRSDSEYINELVLTFLGGKLGACNKVKCQLGLHPLDLYRRSLLGGSSDEKIFLPLVGAADPDPLLSAEELYEAGVNFRAGKTDGSLLDIEFKGGTLTLPPLRVDDTTEWVFFNIVAFEHLHVGTGYEVTAYVAFMDDLVDSANDVKLLHKMGIIKNATGSNVVIADLFNSLSKEVTLDPPARGRLAKVRMDVHEYYRSWLHVRKWQAHFVRTHFKTPWSAIAFVAATIALLLSIARTVSSILPVYHRLTKG